MSTKSEHLERGVDQRGPHRLEIVDLREQHPGRQRAHLADPGARLLHLTFISFPPKSAGQFGQSARDVTGTISHGTVESPAGEERDLVAAGDEPFPPARR